MEVRALLGVIISGSSHLPANSIVSFCSWVIAHCVYGPHCHCPSAGHRGWSHFLAMVKKWARQSWPWKHGHLWSRVLSGLCPEYGVWVTSQFCFLFVKKPPAWFPKWLHSFPFPMTVRKALLGPYPHWHLYSWWFHSDQSGDGGKMESWGSFNLSFTVGGGCWTHPFKCLLAISISSFENVLLGSMAHFKNWIVSFSWYV